MSPCARSGLMEALLRVVVISAITVTWTQGQVTSFGGCPSYQTSPDVVKTYNATMIAETAGYNILMSTDAPSAGGCYVFKFKADQIFTLDYVDSNYDMVTNEGWFEFYPKTFTDSGSIYLGLAPSVLGAGLFGGSRMYIIYVATDYFVAISCSSGVFKTEHVHVFAKAAAMATLTPTIATINSTLETEGIPHATMFREVDQVCTKPPLDPQSGLLLQLMSLLGVSCPTSRDLIAQYRSALERSTGSTPPKHHLISNFNTPVQDVTYPRIKDPASHLPTRQFTSNYGSGVPVGTYPGNVDPASPLPTHQFTSNFGAGIPGWTYPRYINPASPLPTLQFSSHNGVPNQVGTYPGIRHPVLAAGSGQVQPYYFYDPAQSVVGFSPSGVFRPPYSRLQIARRK